ncbi:hypothetical protein HYH02_013016 [Chlamydomonas schloesseri]|uniref:Uncharacterized protein n=1 Tax=Chlamydomonas schloesseri TaxID=2026947 RepID=A0A835SSE9_9CHLO|nr:hypothetical protein HYH02_013016 [Chlamydomonas schloesseri]|eukprot:KAG2432293.1 hypothetical protein HYH02_013016 [Chlamydomonas schloesseri]
MPPGLASWLACFGSQPKTHVVKHQRPEPVKEVLERAQTHGQVNSGSNHRAGPLAEPWKAKSSGAGVRPSVGGPSGSVPLASNEKVTTSGKSAPGEKHSDSYQGRLSAPTQPTAERAAALHATADAAAAAAAPKLSQPGGCTSAPVDAPVAKSEVPAPALPLDEAPAATRSGAQTANPLQKEQPQWVAQVSLEIEPHEGAGCISGPAALDIPPAAAEAEAEAAAAAAAAAVAAAGGGKGLQRKQRSKRVAEDGGGPRGGDGGESIPHADTLGRVLAAAERTDAWVATTLPAPQHAASGRMDASGEHQQHQQPPTSQRTSSKRLLTKRASSKRIVGDTGAPPPPPVLRASTSGRLNNHHHHHQQQSLQPPRVSASGALYASAPEAAAAIAAGGGNASAAASRKALLSKGPSMRQDLLGMALTELHDILEAAAPPSPAAAPAPAAAAAAANHGGAAGRESETGGPGGGSGVAAGNDPRELSKAVLQVLQKMPSSRKMMAVGAAAAGHQLDAAAVHKAHSSRAIASKAHSAKALLAATPSARELEPQPTTTGGGGGGGVHATAAGEAAAAAAAASEVHAPAGATASRMAASIEVVPEEDDEQQARDVPAVATRPTPPPQKDATFRKTHSSARRPDALARGASSGRSPKDLLAPPRPQLDTANRGLLDGEDAAAGRTLVRVIKRFSEAGPEAAAQYVASGDATTSAATAPQIKDQAAQRCFNEGMLLSAALRLNSQRHQQEQPQPLRKATSTRQR